MGFNCAEHKWQHLLNPCPICSYKYSSADIASETNQNDTQDETEKLAEEAYPDTRIMGEMVDRSHERMVFVDGYRAGVATNQADLAGLIIFAEQRGYKARELEHAADRKMNAALREENSRLKESLSAVTVIQQRDATIKELADSRAEVERLKLRNDYLEERISDEHSDLRFVQEQLAAEKQKALKLVEALKVFMSYYAVESSQSRASKDLFEALSAYSTDSGDGEKG